MKEKDHNKHIGLMLDYWEDKEKIIDLELDVEKHWKELDDVALESDEKMIMVVE